MPHSLEPRSRVGPEPRLCPYRMMSCLWMPFLRMSHWNTASMSAMVSGMDARPLLCP